jgi:hypothetical protein
MSWSEIMKAAALASPARRGATVVRSSVDVPWSWNPHEVWLKRVRPARERAARSIGGQPPALRKETTTRS